MSVIKADRHDHDGEEHFNQYDSLIFGDVEGRRWRLYADNQPGHYQQLSNDSSLSAALDVYNLPAERQGPLDLLESQGRVVNFSTGPSTSGRSGSG